MEINDKKLCIKPFSVFKMQELYDSNKFLQSVLSQESAGSWFVDANANQLQEINRLLIMNKIKHYYKQ